MAFVNNMILAKFLGLCPFFGVSKRTSSAAGMGLAVIFVMLVATIVTWPIYYFILKPFGVELMKTVVFILVIASAVQIIELTIKRTNVSLYNALGIYLPLITTNCAVLGITFISVEQGFTFAQSLAAAFGAGVGFLIVLLIMSGIRERLELADVPEAFKGSPIAFITATLLALSFLAFNGMV
jgi:electron transport complex protein RnfA